MHNFSKKFVRLSEKTHFIGKEAVEKIGKDNNKIKAVEITGKDAKLIIELMSNMNKKQLFSLRSKRFESKSKKLLLRSICFFLGTFTRQLLL